MGPRKFLALCREVARHDFVVTYPARNLALGARYRPEEAGLPEGRILEGSRSEVRWACRLTRRPLVLWPVLAGIMVEQKRSGGEGRSCLRRLALAMTRLARRHPLRFRRAWGLKGKTPGMARALWRRWRIASVPHADFVVAGWGSAAALAYAGENSPRVLAMGTGADARLLRALADEHGIPVVENDSCVQVLLDDGWDSEPAPEESWEALIEVMKDLAQEHPELQEKWRVFVEKEEP